MIHVGQGAKLLLEQVEGGRGGVQERLDRQRLAAVAVPRLVHRSHSAASEMPDDLVAFGTAPVV